MKDINLDILKNADDDIIGELVLFSSDDDKTRKRVLSMSEKKYNKMKKTDLNDQNTEVVEGVERYHRPVWHRPLCAAAAVAVIAGGAGTFALLSRNNGVGSAVKSPAAQVTDEAEFIVPQEQITTQQSADMKLTPNEMKAVYDEFFAVFRDRNDFLADDKLNTDETLEFWLYDCEDDGTYAPEAYARVKLENGRIYTNERFYKLEDARFGNISEMKAYYGRYFTAPETIIQFSGDMSGYEPGACIPDVSNSCGIIEYNGALYASEDLRAVNSKAPELNDILGELWEYEGDSGAFCYTRYFRVEYNGIETAYGVSMHIVPEGTDNWKVGRIEVEVSEYDVHTDYSERRLGKVPVE
ncbi:MAG: hypothetical protein IKO47_10820 [Ruminococcus sp.]|nr:hypothetical protein [Ruminococcus sp.]